MRKVSLFLISCGLMIGCLFAKYKIKEIQVKAAGEYASHQESQNLIIGARVFRTDEEILSIFDTERLLKEKLMPVLLVVENNNDFAVRVYSKDIYLVSQGLNHASIPGNEVLSRITSKKKKTANFPSGTGVFRKGSKKHKDLIADFQRKSFGERLIPPHGSDFGVVFFPQVEIEGRTRLYLPTLLNLETQENLMFFEFELSP